MDCLESVGADCAVISSRIYFEIQWKFDDLYAVFLYEDEHSAEPKFVLWCSCCAGASGNSRWAAYFFVLEGIKIVMWHGRSSNNSNNECQWCSPTNHESHGLVSRLQDKPSTASAVQLFSAVQFSAVQLFSSTTATTPIKDRGCSRTEQLN